MITSQPRSPADGACSLPDDAVVGHSRGRTGVVGCTARIGRPVARLGVVMTMEGPSFGSWTAPPARTSLPISSSRAQHIWAKPTLTVRGRVANQVAQPPVLRLEPLFDHHLHPARRRFFIPLLLGSPSVSVTQDWDGMRLSTGSSCPAFSFKGLDIRIEQRRGRVLAGVEFGNQAVWLEPLDERVDLMERDFVVRDPAPGRVPAVEDEHVDLAIVAQQLGQLGLDAGDLLWRDVVVPDIAAEVEDRVVQPDRQPAGGRST